MCQQNTNEAMTHQSLHIHYQTQETGKSMSYNLTLSSRSSNMFANLYSFVVLSSKHVQIMPEKSMKCLIMKYFINRNNQPYQYYCNIVTFNLVQNVATCFATFVFARVHRNVGKNTLKS